MDTLVRTPCDICGISVKRLERDYSKRLLAHVNRLWKVSTPSFPGPQPVSIERKHFDALRSDEYLVGVKNDGERYCIVFANIDNRDVCVLLDRSLVAHLVPLRASKRLYEGTIIDGEMVDGNFVAFDCPVYGGIDVHQCKFSERLRHISRAVACIQRLPDNMAIEVKSFVTLKDIGLLNIDVGNCDGIVFMPENRKVCLSTHPKMFKWKPNSLNTIDFGVKGRCVYLQNDGRLTKKMIKVHHDHLSEHMTDGEMYVLECEHVNDKEWVAIKIRHDKELPNSVYTYQRTLINIQEDIAIEEFTGMGCT